MWQGTGPHLHSYLAALTTGMVWYGNGMFGPMYERLEFNGAKKLKPVEFSMQGMMVNTLVKCIFLHALYMLLGFSDIVGTMIVGLLLAGMDCCGLMEDYLFSNRSFPLIMIHVGYSFVNTQAVLLANWVFLGV